MGHAATIARKYERDHMDETINHRQLEQKAKAVAEKQAEKQRESLLEQARSEATKLVTDARTAIQGDLLAHQARIAQVDYATNQDYINNSSGPAYLDYPSYPHTADSHYNYVDPSFPPATILTNSSPTPIFAQPGALYKQNAYATMQRGRPPNPAGSAMPKGYPPPPNPPNSGPPTPVDHCNICGLHKTECEAIGSRYTDPHTNISHCYLRDKIAGSFNLDFRALDALKLNNLTKDKRERVIAASAKYGVLYSAPPQTLAAYRDRFNVPDPAHTPSINQSGSA